MRHVKDKVASCIQNSTTWRHKGEWGILLQEFLTPTTGGREWLRGCFATVKPARWEAWGTPEESHASVGNQTKIFRSSSPQPSHYADRAKNSQNTCQSTSMVLNSHSRYLRIKCFYNQCTLDWKTMDPTTANGSVAETFDPCLFGACRPSLPAATYSAILKLSSTNITVANTSCPRG